MLIHTKEELGMRRMLLCLRILRGYAGRNGGLLVLLASCVLTVFPCFSQTTATLTVRLSDPNGLSLTEAELTLENRSTGFSRELRGQGDGEFQLVGITPQTYRLLVRAANKDIAQLDVPVQYVRLVHHLQPPQQRVHKAYNLIFLEGLAILLPRCRQFVQRQPVFVLHHQVGGAVGLEVAGVLCADARGGHERSRGERRREEQ